MCSSLGTSSASGSIRSRSCELIDDESDHGVLWQLVHVVALELASRQRLGTDLQLEMLALFVESLVSHLDRNLGVIVERDTDTDGRLGNSVDDHA